MSEVEKLPNGWEVSKIGEVCEPSQYGYTAKAGDKGNYHYLRTTDITKPELDWDNVPFCEISEEEAEKYLLKDNDIVISRAGSIGYSYLISKAKKSVFASYLIRFRPLINPKYFRYFLDSQQYWNAILAGSSGIAVQNVNAKTLSLIDLPIAPEKEQQRIVEKLDEIFSELYAGIDELKTAQIKISQYRQTLLKSAVEGSLTQQWRAENSAKVQETGEQLLARILKQRREQWQQQKLAEFAGKGKTPPKNWQDKYPEPLQPNTSDLHKLPEGWVWASLDQLTTYITSGSRGWAKYYSDSGAIFVRAQNIKTDELLLDDIAFVSLGDSKEGMRTRLQKNDVLLTITGANVGKCALVKKELDEAYVSQHVSLIRPSTLVSSHYIHLNLITPTGGRKYLDDLAYGAGKPGLNLQQIASTPIPLPPLNEQNVLYETIYTSLDALEIQNQAIRSQLKTTEAQRKNILKSAFSGQLVPQAPNDEPASVLLEKIKQEREALAKMPKPRKQSKPKKDDLMNTLLEVLTAENGWIDAQDAFKKCGIVDEISTDRIEEIYTELRKLEKAGKIQIQRQGDFDQLKLSTPDVKESECV
ncbi:restriction endonuclease subunit S [Vreelandella alkaliphila]|uniref:restriction endonuclease subunit S n=1 Tax=Vreelandella alkaliphila TaxID=272774 RepID=UPI003FD88642